MCGIYASPFPGAVEAMLWAMRYRGPDSSVVIRRGGFSVGLARLAIVGERVREADQPMVTKKGRVLAFNGEFYNYLKLLPRSKSEVEALGDLLDAGLDPRQYIDGDYAIVYHNPSQKTLTLYRDRFGVCPLYYSLAQDIVEVSSERRRLVFPKEVAAHGKVVIDLKSAKVLRSDRFQHYGITGTGRGLREFQLLLRDAVESRATHSDVGFSLALSGGVDSTLIAFTLRDLGLQPRNAICVTVGEGSDDERCARLVARACRFNLDIVNVTPETIKRQSPVILDHLDMDRAKVTKLKWRGAVRNFFAAKHSQSRVILSGEGADELVAGYPSHWARARSPLEVAAKSLSTIRSMPHINLDRTNKLGMAHGKEYRCPFLESTLSYYLLSTKRNKGKLLFRETLRELGAPPEVIEREKYGNDEPALEATAP